MTPRTLSSFLIPYILIFQQVFCQDDVQSQISQMLKRIEKLETVLKEKSELITEITTVSSNLIYWLKKKSNIVTNAVK